MPTRTLPEAIQDALARSGKTRAEVYETMGYTVDAHGGCPALSRWATGKVTPDVARLAALATATGRPIVFSVDGVTVRFSPQKEGSATDAE